MTPQQLATYQRLGMRPNALTQQPSNNRNFVSNMRNQISNALQSNRLAQPWSLDYKEDAFPKVSSSLNQFNPSWQKLALAEEQYNTREDAALNNNRGEGYQPTEYISSGMGKFGQRGDVRKEWNTDNNLSPLSFDQYMQAKKNTPAGYMFDYMGRQLAPGTRINVGNGSYYEYAPSRIRIAEIASPGEGGNTIPLGEDPNDWKPVGNPKVPIVQALAGSGVMPDIEWQGTIGKGGWNAIQGLVSTMAPGIQMVSPVAGAAVNAARGAQSIYNAVNSGDTVGGILGGISTVAGIGGAQGLQGAANLGQGINSYIRTGNPSGLANSLIGAAGQVAGEFIPEYKDYIGLATTAMKPMTNALLQPARQQRSQPTQQSSARLATLRRLGLA